MDTVVTWSSRIVFGLLAFASFACTNPAEVEASPEDYTEMRHLDEPVEFALAKQTEQQGNNDEGGQKSNSGDKAVNLNRASGQKLKEIPGIGPALADRILQYRSERAFKEASDLKRIDGIGDVSFRKMKPYVSVN